MTKSTLLPTYPAPANIAAPLIKTAISESVTKNLRINFFITNCSMLLLAQKSKSRTAVCCFFKSVPG